MKANELRIGNWVRMACLPATTDLNTDRKKRVSPKYIAIDQIEREWSEHWYRGIELKELVSHET